MPARPFHAIPLDDNRILTAHQLLVDGVHLNYFELTPAEPSTKSPLLVLHQLLATAETLAPLIAQLPADRRIIALDILSATPVSGSLEVTQAALTKLISHFLQAIGLDRPVLIGHSHGGALALRLAATHPAEFPGLILLSPAHPFGGYRSHVVNFYLTRWGRFLALSIPLAPSWMILRAYNQAAGPTGPIRMQQLKPYLRILRDRDALRRVLEMLHCWQEDMDQLSNLLLAAPLTQPVLLLWGDHDVIVPPDSSVALQQALPTSQLLTLAGRGHLLPDEAAADCAALIDLWLRNHELQSSLPPA
jgi:pimeloyl-ACP methyl ester carboxylesterase